MLMLSEDDRDRERAMEQWPPLCQPTLIFTYSPFFAHFLGHLDVKTVDDAYQNVKERSIEYCDVSVYMGAQDAKLAIHH